MATVVSGLTYDTTTLNSRIDTRADQRIASSVIAITSVQTAANETAHLALTTQEGDIVVRSDQSKSYVRNSGTAGTMADFTELLTPTDQVLSVNGNTGAITAAQIAAAVETASDSNTFTDADHTKLNAIEASADVTDATNVAAAGAAMLTGAAFTGAVSLSSTDAGETANPILTLDRNSASPADNDVLADIHFKGRNSAGEEVTYGSFMTKIDDASDGTEDGRLIYKTMKAGALTTVLDIKPDQLKVNNVSEVYFGDPVTNIKFEGATGNSNETTIQITDPTADRTITVPDASGTILLSNQNITGSAATLTTPRAINGVNFDGSADITIVDSTKIATAGGTFTGSVIFEDAINENVFAITDAASVAIDPDNGTIQTWTLGANRTATDSLTSGQSVLLMITAGSNTLTWMTITWAGGSAPTLSTSSTTAIELWKVGTTLYGANVGDV